MPTAIIEHDGKDVEYEFPEGMSEDEILANFQSDFAKYQIDARNQLRVGKEPTERRSKRGKRIFHSTQSTIERNFHAALGVGVKDVDTKNGIPQSQRAVLSGLRDDASRFAYLAKEYGQDKVEVLNIAGKEEFAIQGKDGKWRMTDPKGVIEFADFTSDIAGEIIPTTTGIVTGTAAFFSGYGTLTTAFAANAAEATVGAAQDAFVRGLAGVEIDPLEIAKRRSTNMVIGTGAEIATLGFIQNAPKLFVARSGADNATKSAQFLNAQTGKKLPTQMYLGEQTMARIQEVAQKYPNSPTAQLWEDLRTKIGQAVDQEIGAPAFTAEQSDTVIQKSLERIAREQSGELDRLKSRLSDIGAQQKVAVEKGRGPGLSEKAKQDAQQVFNAERKRKAKDLIALNEVPTRAVGDGLQADLFKKYLRVDAQKKQLYNEAYDAVGDARVSSLDIGEAYEAIVSEGIEDFDGEIINALSDVASRKGLKSAQELGEIGEIEVPFRVLNELIQSVNRRAKFGVTGAGPEANKFRTLSSKLQTLRDEVLESRPDAKPAFDRAQQFYREEFLRYTDGLGGDILKLPRGQSFSESINAFSRDQVTIPMPRFKNDGISVVQRALRSPSDVDEIIKLSQTPNETRQFLRQAWLQKQGLTADGGLPKSAFDLSDEQKEIVRALWPQKNAAGKNVKLETFSQMRNFASKEKEYIDGITRDTFQKLMQSNTEISEKELMKLAAEELSVKESFAKLQKSAIQKMVSKGALEGTAKDNIRILMDTIDSLDFKQIKEVKRLLIAKDPANEELLRNSMVSHILKKANKGADDAQVGRYGFQLWNPTKMENILKKDEAKLSILLGDEKYKLLGDWNDALKTISIPRTVADTGDLRAGLATSGTGASGYISGITDWARNAWTNTMLSVSLKAPTQKILMDPKSYDNMISYLMNVSVPSVSGLGALTQQMEDSPEVSAMVQQTFSGLMQDMADAEKMKRQLEAQKEQQVEQQQGQ